MIRCKVKPYKGEQDFIFVSYCHKDKDIVFPIIEQMARDGYRVWYDEGINPGSEWPEVIAEHLDDCALCIAFISENALNSHNCRREINYSLLKKKPMISVMVENVSLSPGMQMQLSSIQSIRKANMTDEEFFKKLYDSSLMISSLRSQPKEKNDPEESDVKTVDEFDPEQKDDDRRDSIREKKPLNKRLIAIIAITGAAAVLILAVIVIVFTFGSKTDTKEKKINSITDIEAECSGLFVDVKDFDISYENYQYYKTDIFPEHYTGVVIHGVYETQDDTGVDYYTEVVEIYKDDAYLGEATSCFLSDNKDLIISLPYNRSTLEPGDYSLAIAVEAYTGDSDETSLAGTITIDFKAAKTDASKTISFTLNRAYDVTLNDHIGETIDFYNGKVSYNSDYYLDFGNDYNYKVPLESNYNWRDYYGKYVCGKAKVVKSSEYHKSTEGFIALEVIEIYDNDTIYMPYCILGEADKTKKQLAELGIQFEEVIDTDETYKSEYDYVIAQSITPGSMIDSDTVVKLTISIHDSNKSSQAEAPQFIPADCKQLLSVTSSGEDSKAIANLYENIDNEWKITAEYDAFVAENGIGKAHEGSKTTPEGIFPLGTVLMAEGAIDTNMDVYPVSKDTCFVDDVDSPLYNNVLESNDIPSGTHTDPVGESLNSNKMNAMIIIEFNGTGFSRSDVEKGEGSAIGVRGRNDELKLTLGDVDISSEDMEDLLMRLDASKKPMIEITSGKPEAETLLNTSTTVDTDTGHKDVSVGFDSKKTDNPVLFKTDEDIKLNSDTITDGTLLERLYAISCYNEDMIAAYDMSFIKNGKEVNPNNEVEISIPCNNSKAQVFYVDEPNNKATDMKAEYKEGYLVFETKTPGYYVVAYIE